MTRIIAKDNSEELDLICCFEHRGDYQRSLYFLKHKVDGTLEMNGSCITKLYKQPRGNIKKLLIEEYKK